jgi:hypothetical protein
LAKKLKKKIEEMCGLAGLEWEERQARATQILASPEWKQQLCNELLGLSFRELERTLTGVANEREKKEDSYARKLEAYSSGGSKTTRDNKSPKRNGSRSRVSGNPSVSKGLQQQKPPPRTLAEILAQVHAPRESPETFKRGESLYMALSSKAQTEESSEVFPGPDDGYSVPEEG